MIEVKREDVLDGVGEIGVDFETVEIADDEERRISEIVAVELELAKGCADGTQVIVRVARVAAPSACDFFLELEQS